jgi:hypothetical protein
MCLLTKFIILIIILTIFYLINDYLKKIENFCYGNDYCNGNKNNALCINQKCLQCGLVPECTKDSDCSPNNCIKGCCDTA